MGVRMPEEYLEAGRNMRQFGNICFAILTFYVAITAGLMSAVFNENICREELICCLITI